jgi:hypothetical protein
VEVQSFDSLTRQTVGGTARRGTLLSLAAAGLFAALASPKKASAGETHAEKKGGGKKKKHKKQVQPAPQECPPVPEDLCPAQVQPCADIFGSVCNGNPDCPEVVACCSHLGECDFGQFFTCVLIAGQS